MAILCLWVRLSKTAGTWVKHLHVNIHFESRKKNYPTPPRCCDSRCLRTSFLNASGLASRMAGGKSLKAVTMPYLNLRRPDSERIEGVTRASALRVERWWASPRVIRPRARGSGLHVKSIRFNRVRPWYMYRLWALSQFRSRSTSLIWSNFRRPD